MKRIFFAFAFLLIGLSGFAQTKFIPASHEAIRYVGRFDFSNPQEVRYDRSGVYIQFSFSGSDCAVKMSDTGHNYYNSFVDDQPSKTFEVKSDTTLLIATKLGSQIHRIRIYKRTEGNQGTGSFKGVLISEKGEMLAWKEVPNRKMEFIGNSITCGYGSEGLSKSERWKPSTENNYQSYVPIMARAFKADYHINEVVKQYGNLPIFCVVGPMMDEPCYSYVKEMVEEFRSVNQKKNVYFVGIPSYLMDPEKDLGSDTHPNYIGQRKMAAHVLPVISSILGWDYLDSEL